MNGVMVCFQYWRIGNHAQGFGSSTIDLDRMPKASELDDLITNLKSEHGFENIVLTGVFLLTPEGRTDA